MSATHADPSFNCRICGRPFRHLGTDARMLLGFMQMALQAANSGQDATWSLRPFALRMQRQDPHLARTIACHLGLCGRAGEAT